MGQLRNKTGVDFEKQNVNQMVGYQNQLNPK